MAQSPERGRSHARARNARGRQFLVGAALAALALVAALALGLVGTPEPESTGEQAAPAADALPGDAAETVDAAGERPVYPHSIIPGGAETAEELVQAIEADPVVAAHFAAFDLSRIRVETLEKPRIAHVSYRTGQDVFWTRKPVVIPAGERVLTDGSNFARVRCGNCLADAPGPVSEAEPDPEVLDTPQPPGGDDPTDSEVAGPIDPAPPGTEIGGPQPGPSSTPGGGGPPGSGNPGPGSGSPGPGSGTPGPGSGTPGPGSGNPGSSTGSGNPSGPIGGGVSGGGPGTVPGGPPGDPGSPGGPGSPGIPPVNPGDPGTPGAPPGGPHAPPPSPIEPHGGPPIDLPPPGGLPPPGAPWLPPGTLQPPGGGWPPPGDPGGLPGDPVPPPGGGDVPGPDDPQDPPDFPNQEDHPKTIPEPGTTALMLLGGAWILRRRRRAG